MKRYTVVFIILGILILVCGIISFALWKSEEDRKQNINSFEDCVQAGYPVLLSYPGQCIVPGGKHFTQNINY